MEKKIPIGLRFSLLNRSFRKKMDAMLSEKELTGVIVFTHRLNAYWPNGNDPRGMDESRIPLCSSMDGKIGVNNATGEVVPCESCPFNEYGSGVRDDGTAARGKACKNMRRVYMVMDGDPNYYLLTVPPTSIKDVNKALQKIIASRSTYTSQVVTLKLIKQQSRDGKDYSKVVLTKAGPLPPAAAIAAKEIRAEIKRQYKTMTITLGDYYQDKPQAATPATPAGAFVDVTDDDPLPFD